MTDPSRQLDWRTISRDWQGHDLPPSLLALQPRLRRETRRLALATAADLVAFVVAALLLGALTLARPTPLLVVAALVVTALNIWITAFSIANRRGSWRAATATPHGHVALLRTRAQAMMRASRFARNAAVAQSVAVVAYVAVGADGYGSPVRPVVWAAALTVMLFLAYLRFAFRQRVRATDMLREADELAALLHDGDSHDGDSHDGDSHDGGDAGTVM